MGRWLRRGRERLCEKTTGAYGNSQWFTIVKWQCLTNSEHARSGSVVGEPGRSRRERGFELARAECSSSFTSKLVQLKTPNPKSNPYQLDPRPQTIKPIHTSTAALL